ncbi:MAG TPA: bifunctional nicotinamidase/pyrazinamidase [Myxococcota bacterium]|nr:bifunctional nicotinamidase/pyrazinamidase [Myxococcota bacterium]
MKALLLIDLQNDFMPGGALPVPDGFASIKAANTAQQFFKIVIATKDWHPREHLSFAENHSDRSPGEIIDLFGLRQTLWPVHCVQNTSGASLVRDLDQTQIQHVVTKGENIKLDSYSAFFDNAHRHTTGLSHYLNQRSIDEVYLLGVATEYCIKFSAIDAVKLGIKTNVIIDGCRGIGLFKDDIPQAITEMLDYGVRLINLADLPNEF